MKFGFRLPIGVLGISRENRSGGLRFSEFHLPGVCPFDEVVDSWLDLFPAYCDAGSLNGHCVVIKVGQKLQKLGR